MNRVADFERLVFDVVALSDSVVQSAEFKRLLENNFDFSDALTRLTILQVVRVLTEEFEISDRAIVEFIAILEGFGYIRMLLANATIEAGLERSPIVAGLREQTLIEMNLQNR